MSRPARWAPLLATVIWFQILLGRTALHGEPTCPPGGTELRWEGFAQPLFQANCRCHTWEQSYAQTYRFRVDILTLVAAGNMPPFTPLPDQERNRLAEWIACDLPLDGTPCPEQGSPFGYIGFADAFFAKNCRRCHSRELSGDARQGAPEGLDWDDYTAVVANSSRIRDVLVRVQMPPDEILPPSPEVDYLLEWISCGAPEHVPGTVHRRADVNEDGEHDISDAVAILAYLFSGTVEIHCLDAADTDGSGALDLSDGVYFLLHLFLDGPPPPEPFTFCGSLPVLGCESYPGCS